MYIGLTAELACSFQSQSTVIIMKFCPFTVSNCAIMCSINALPFIADMHNSVCAYTVRLFHIGVTARSHVLRGNGSSRGFQR